MKTIGEKIRESRIRIGLTQAELAEKAGLTKRSVSKYENDAVVPRGLNLHRIAEVLGVSEAYLTKQDIDDPAYGLEEAPYVAEARKLYGKKGAEDMNDLLGGVRQYLAGGDVPQSDKDLFFQAVMEAYVETKQEAHDKFTPNKYRKG